MKDGLWEFDDTGIAIADHRSGRFVGWVSVENHEISRIWLETAQGPYLELARGSWLWTALAAALHDDLPSYIAWQSERDQHFIDAANFSNAVAMHSVLRRAA